MRIWKSPLLLTLACYAFIAGGVFFRWWAEKSELGAWVFISFGLLTIVGAIAVISWALSGPVVVGLSRTFLCGDFVIGADGDGEVENWCCARIRYHRGLHSNGKRKWVLE